MRVFNAREIDRKQDKLPKKFFKALKGTGPTAGIALKLPRKLIPPLMNITSWQVGLRTVSRLLKR